MRRAIVLSLVLALAPLAALAQPAASPAAAARVRGTVTAVSATSLTVATASGAQTVVLAHETSVFGVEPATLAEVIPGAYLGTTVEPQPNGTLISKEIHIFAPSMRGLGEGYRPMTGEPHSMMANATVATPAPSMMANATVNAAEASGSGKSIRLVYQGGTQTVSVPADTPIVKYVPGSPALLIAGKHVSVSAAAAGSELAATRIYVGEKGVVPR